MQSEAMCLKTVSFVASAIVWAGVPVSSRAIGWPSVLLSGARCALTEGGEIIEFIAVTQYSINITAMRENAHYVISISE